MMAGARPPVLVLDGVLEGELTGAHHPELKSGNVVVEFRDLSERGGSIRLVKSCYDLERAHGGPHKVPYRVSWTLTTEPPGRPARLETGMALELAARLEVEGRSACAHAMRHGPMVWLMTNGTQESALVRARRPQTGFAPVFSIRGNERLSLAEGTDSVKAQIAVQRLSDRGGYFGVIAHLGYPGITAEAMYMYKIRPAR